MRKQGRYIMAILLAIGIYLPGCVAAHNDAAGAFLARLGPHQGIKPLELNAFGEQIGYQFGTLSFLIKDIELQGTGPDIVISRSFDISSRRDHQWQHYEGFADWTFEIPRLSSKAWGWLTQANYWTAYRPFGNTAANSNYNRCSDFMGAHPGSAEAAWYGIQLHLPTGERHEVLKRSSENTQGNSHLVTSSHWAISCLPSTKNGAPGDAFLATSPSGTKYWFDWYVRGSSQIIGTYIGGQAETNVFLYASRIEDRFGNHISFTYQDHRLTRIEGSDGRSVLFTWTNKAPTLPRFE